MDLKPMLAIPMDKATITDWSHWAIEQKFDGHRLLVEVAPSGVTAWTRPRRHAGADGKTMAVRTLPSHLVDAMSQFPAGVYDGELLGGKTSTDVTRTDLQTSLVFVIFDVLRIGASLTTVEPYDDRRYRLEAIFECVPMRGTEADANVPAVRLAQSVALRSQADAQLFLEYIWKQGGEGAILKRRQARYAQGKRSPDFVKLKKLHTAVCTVIGFEPTRGKVLDRGLFATVLLRDDDGHETSVKTKDDLELEKFRKEWEATKAKKRLYADHVDDVQRYELRLANNHHPALGRKLRIEYQERAANGGYRHPRWDRWEDE